MKASIISSIILAGLLIVAALFMTRGPSASSSQGGSSDAVTIDGNKQVITIQAGRGYYPRQVVAKANTDTTLRMVSGTSFDCSSFLVIPSIGYQGRLENGNTDIIIPPQKPGSVIRGSCAMGMYSFSIKFE